jgi:hypothetical protein
MRYFHITIELIERGEKKAGKVTHDPTKYRNNSTKEGGKEKKLFIIS